MVQSVLRATLSTAVVASSAETIGICVRWYITCTA